MVDRSNLRDRSNVQEIDRMYKRSIECTTECRIIKDENVDQVHIKLMSLGTALQILIATLGCYSFPASVN